MLPWAKLKMPVALWTTLKLMAMIEKIDPIAMPRTTMMMISLSIGPPGAHLQRARFQFAR